jgi:hypothetical protein
MACGSKRTDGARYGPSRAVSTTSRPPATASVEAVSIAGRQASPNSVVMRYGTALPSVSAPINSPSAKPRRARNQPAAIFIAGGYTAARPMPVAKRSAITTHGPGASSTAAFAAAPASAPAQMRRGPDTRSAMLMNAPASVPATKPACTAMVSQAASLPLKERSRASAGVTAVAENHSVMPRNCASAMMPSWIQAPGGDVSWDRIKEPCRYPTRRRRSTMASTSSSTKITSCRWWR